MTDILTRPEPQTEEEYEAALGELWEEIAYLRTLMDADQIEIERLQAELRQLKAETDTIMAETHDIMTNLKAMVFCNADNEQHEREKMALRMEINLLRLQQALPPVPPETPQSDA